MAVMTGWIAQVRRQGRLVAFVALGAVMTLFGLVHAVWIGLVCLAIAGAMDVISTVLHNTIIQMVIYTALVTDGPRLGDLESGVVVNFTATEYSIVSGGVACIVGVIALMRWRPTFWNREVP